MFVYLISERESQVFIKYNGAATSPAEIPLYLVQSWARTFVFLFLMILAGSQDCQRSLRIPSSGSLDTRGWFRLPSRVDLRNISSCSQVLEVDAGCFSAVPGGSLDVCPTLGSAQAPLPPVHSVLLQPLTWHPVWLDSLSGAPVLYCPFMTWVRRNVWNPQGTRFGSTHPMSQEADCRFP